LILAVKLGIVVAALIVLLRLKLDLAPALLLSAAVTILLFQINIVQAARAAVGMVIAPKTLELYVIILMVLYISEVQKARKMFEKLIRSLNVMIRDSRLVAMVSPAIIGFLPMLGGALFSAPLVEEAVKKMEWEPEFKTFVNYWFRHLWEFVWPVYAGLLIFQTLSHIPLKKIILFQSPFTLLNIVSGAVVCFLYFRRHRIGRRPSDAVNHAWGTLRDFFGGIWPLLLVILLYFIFSIPLYIALPLTAVLLTLAARFRPREIAAAFFSRIMLRTLILLAAVMAFQGIIEISNISAALSEMEVSLGMIVFFSFLISFSMGFLTGVNVAYIAIAYPIMLPLIQHQPNFLTLSLYVFVIGFAGILLSPLHLCLVLTNEYFKSTLFKVYYYLVPPVLLLIIISTALALLL
jgi:integral membrane protein (TIGR00529 family)